MQPPPIRIPVEQRGLGGLTIPPRTTLARTSTSTCAAPAARRVLAHSATVAPLVKTSSIKMMRLSFNRISCDGGMKKAFLTLATRSVPDFLPWETVLRVKRALLPHQITRHRTARRQDKVKRHVHIFMWEAIQVCDGKP